jgi:hypothetical protein
MKYVPRVLAAAVVCGDPQRYGLEPRAPAASGRPDAGVTVP